MPIFDIAGIVSGYLITPSTPVPLLRADLHPELELAYLDLDLPSLALDRTVFLVATPHMIDGSVGIPRHGGQVGLVVTPSAFGHADVVEHLESLRKRGYQLALSFFKGTDAQVAMLPHHTHVIVDENLTHEESLAAVAQATAAGVRIIVPRLSASEGTIEQLPGVHAFIGAPTSGPAVEIGEQELLPNEIACLEAVRLLGEPDVNIEAVSHVLGSDPALVLRVLRLVNGAAVGLAQRVDSVKRAIVLLGPGQVQGLVMASLVASTTNQLDNLWLLIARGLTCERLAPGHDSAYTVGLLSALSTERGIPAQILAERTRLSEVAYDALVLGEGPLGAVLRAVVAHERNDLEAVEAAGLEVSAVTRAYFDAIPDALDAVLTALTPSGAEL